jgi:DNA mismatch repair protein MSH3
VRELKESGEETPNDLLEETRRALLETHGKNVGDAERYLSRAFHGTATPAELVAGLGSISGLAEKIRAISGWKRDVSRTPREGHREDDPDVFPRSALLRRLFAEAADPSASAICASLVGAVDAKAAREGRATPATALVPDPARFPELETTREALEAAEKALEDLLPSLRDVLSRGGVSNEPAARGTAGVPDPNSGARLGSKPTGHRAAARGSVPGVLKYVTVACAAYLIELPDSLTDRVPRDWVVVSTNKSKRVVRYHPPVVLEAAQKLARARERHVKSCESAWRGFLRVECAGKFLELRNAVRAAAGLDALASLASLARREGYRRPEFISSDEEDDAAAATVAFLDIQKGRHPILEATRVGGGAVVPNSVTLGTAIPRLADPETGRSDNPRALVVTGPNMGGKSCFVRQTALLVIMAQIGSYVPAESMRLTALRGVHTRMGAADNLAVGRSTFLEEMSECASILRGVRAENPSLVVLDELGRGTSTHDGVAVAHAALEYLVRDAPNVLTLFVTHYPSVARDLTAKYPRRCAAAFTSYAERRKKTPRSPAADADADDDADAGEHRDPSRPVDFEASSGAEEIDFLYALTPGVAHRSFGLNVARMAGVPSRVLRSASEKAGELESATALRSAGRLVREARAVGGVGGVGERDFLTRCDATADTLRRVYRDLRDVTDVDVLTRIRNAARSDMKG